MRMRSVLHIAACNCRIKNITKVQAVVMLKVVSLDNNGLIELYKLIKIRLTGYEVVKWLNIDRMSVVLSYILYIQTAWLLPERYVWVIAIANPFVCVSVCLSSVVCNFGAPYSGVEPFSNNYYFTNMYRGHLLTSLQNFTKFVRGEPLHRSR